MKTKFLFIALTSFVILLGSFSYLSSSAKVVASENGNVRYVAAADSAKKCCKKGEDKACCKKDAAKKGDKHACSKECAKDCKHKEGKKECCKKGEEKACCKKKVEKKEVEKK